MHVVCAAELNAATQRRDEPAALDERRRNRQADQREPGEDERIDPREDPDAGEAHRQEREEADGEGDPEIAAAVDRPHERDRAGVRRGEHQRAGAEHDRGTGRLVELLRGNTDQSRAQPERQRRPKARAVEAQRLGDELADRASLGRKRRREPAGGMVES